MRRPGDDPYDRFADASTTPIVDLAIGLATICLILGGGLAGIYAVGYFAVGRAARAWPLAGTLAVLVGLNVGLRVWRASLRRR